MIDLAPRALWGRPVVIGGGVAGGMAALTLAPQPVMLLDSTPIGGEAASRWAQGGLAAAIGAEDSPEQHALDTIAAGAGLCDAEAARRITAAGPEIVRALEEYGVRFDRDSAGAIALGLEAAHAHRRILHVRDATGAALVEALAARIVETPSIERIAGTALRLVLEGGAIAGVAVRQNGAEWLLPTRAVVLATGGVGALWRSTTNPGAAYGAGLALAGHAGAELADLEFVQFHPTALAVGAHPMPLISEAVRGEGAFLVDAQGERFMAAVPGAELAARDIVARAVFRQWADGGRAALDVRHWPEGRFASRFPNIHRVLAGHGIDPARDPIPVRPAAHYHMGGVKVGPTGRASVAGLWACGEVASTGLQGGNRLASNSLLEAAVCGRQAAQDVAGTVAGEARAPSGPIDLPRLGGKEKIAAMQDLMEQDVGVMRDAVGLGQAIEGLTRLRDEAAGTVAEDAISVALLIALAADRRHESRGAHWRSDFPKPADEARHSVSRWADLPLP